MYPEEASNYIDTVFTGEAEGAWPALLPISKQERSRTLMMEELLISIWCPNVRRDIYKYPYVYDLVQTSRGCPIGCEFCSVTQMYGKSYREREVEDILDELEETPDLCYFSSTTIL